MQKFPTKSIKIDPFKSKIVEESPIKANSLLNANKTHPDSHESGILFIQILSRNKSIEAQSIK